MAKMSQESGIVLYHRTTAENARLILSEGFQDSTEFFQNTPTWKGVWFSAEPRKEPDEVVVKVELDLDEQELAQWEWSGEGRDYREWLIPAHIVNQRSTSKLVDHSDHSTVAA